MSKYIYGASIQGIQSFIFKTNKLKEIVGASAFVDAICKETFLNFANTESDNPNLIMATSGNIKFVCNENNCRRLVRDFPKYISQKAPGITISQAVVPYDKTNIKKHINELEKKLKIQRNKVAFPLETGFMGLERSRRTGGVGYDYDKDGKVRDIATELKIGEQDNFNLFRDFSGLEKVTRDEIPFDTDGITNSNNSWIAVIHADGNGLGKLIQSMSEKIGNDVYAETFKKFSGELEIATKLAAQEAYNKVINPTEGTIRPVRPIILGGDDLTIIIRADLALAFTEEYLKSFEKLTEQHLAFLNEFNISSKLTACAGIAYIKQSYPFHYGVNLADKLCGEAKKMSKNKENFPDTIPSSLSFYQVQDSFIDDFSELKERTLTAQNISFANGPYLIHTADKKNGIAVLEDLKIRLNTLKDLPKDKNSKGISKLRQWISELYINKENADLMMDRIQEVNSSLYDKLQLEEERKKDKTILFDLITLHALNY